MRTKIMLRYGLTAIAMVLAGAPAFAQVTTWEIDPAHSAAHFSVRHMMIATVRGEFHKLTGMVMFDEKEPSKPTVEASIEANTIDTGHEKRDSDLRGAEFFDVAKYPTITFKSKSVARQGEGRFKVTGDLTMRGVTKSVVLDVEGFTAQVKDQRGNIKTGASATTKINRSEFGLTWNRVVETGGVAVSDEVAIVIDLALVKKGPQAAATSGGGSK